MAKFEKARKFRKFLGALGTIVVPHKIREELGLEIGDVLEFTVRRLVPSGDELIGLSVKSD